MVMLLVSSKMARPPPWHVSTGAVQDMGFSECPNGAPNFSLSTHVLNLCVCVFVPPGIGVYVV